MINSGDIIPNIELRTIKDEGVKLINTHKYFSLKKILIICIPGAFTSTCHNQHLPPFISGLEKLYSQKNFDEVCCIASNDPIILELWRNEFKNPRITFISDGNLEFATKTGLIKDYEKSFMGKRIKRCVLTMSNLKITNIFVDESGLNQSSFENVYSNI